MATREINFTFKPARAFKRGRSLPIQSIIVHSSEGRKAGDIATLTGDQVSSHWYVTRAAEVFHFVDDADTADYFSCSEISREKKKSRLRIKSSFSFRTAYHCY